MNDGKVSLKGKKLYKIEGGGFTPFEVALFDWLRTTQRLWLWVESLVTPLVTWGFSLREIDFELVRRFEKKADSQEKLILKLVECFGNAKEIYMTLGEMGHGLMERSDVLEAFVYAKRENNANIQIVHGPRVDPKTQRIFNLASDNIVELYRSPKYFRHHFSCVKSVLGEETIFDEGVHDETVWALDEDNETVPLFTSLARHQYLIKNSSRMKNLLLDEFKYRKSNAQRVTSPPKRFIPSEYSALKIFWTSTFENLPRRHFIQPLENYFDMPMGSYRQNTRKSKGVEMNGKIKWTRKMKTWHYAWFSLFTLMWVVGLADLLLYLFGGQPDNHWFNDVLLMFGALSLTITLVMVLIEEA